MDVTVGDERFDRYYRRIQLGLRLLSHGARAQTASEWSGLTPDRLVTLKRRWMPGADDGFRGPAPTSFKPFFRSGLRASHAALFASIHRVVGLGSKARTEAGDLPPRLDNGERLCEAFEIYREWAPDTDMEFDQAVLLATGTANSEEIQLTQCSSCYRALLIDKLARHRDTCVRCRRQRRR